MQRLRKMHEFKYFKTGDLKPYENNSRTHSKEQIQQVIDSIKEFGFTNPILVDENKNIIAGHCRLMAAQKIDLKEVPCVVLKGLSEAQRKAYVIADNKIPLNAGWDEKMLKIEFEALREMDFDLALTGFNMDEIGSLMPVLEAESFEDEDNAPDKPENPVSKLGDLWELGDHKLYCGDSTKESEQRVLTNGEKIDMVFTDPPYGLGGYKGRGKKSSKAVGNDEKDPSQFYECVPQAPETYVWGGFKNLQHINFEPRDCIVWKKNNFGMGKGYRGQYEVCFYSGGFSGSDSDVWSVDKDVNYNHPTQKPVELCRRAIRNSKPRNIIDIYAGSGSTLMACQCEGIKSYHMELDPAYIDVIIKRWEAYTGEKAFLNGKTYEEVKKERGVK